ncbi:MAG: hypothetical protein WAJ85_14155 [Candidatus Baltobacteraceae bacterium]
MTDNEHNTDLRAKQKEAEERYKATHTGAKVWKARFFWLLALFLFVILSAYLPHLSPEQSCARGDCWWYDH